MQQKAYLIGYSPASSEGHELKYSEGCTGGGKELFFWYPGFELIIV